MKADASTGHMQIYSSFSLTDSDQEMLTCWLCGLRQNLKGVAVLPAVLHILSEMYFWANLAHKRYLPPHQGITRCIEFILLEELGHLCVSLHFWLRWALLFWGSLSLFFLVGALAVGSSSFPPAALLQLSPLVPSPLSSGPFRSSSSCTSWCLTSSNAPAFSMLPQYLGSKMVAFLRRTWIAGDLYLVGTLHMFNIGSQCSAIRAWREVIFSQFQMQGVATEPSLPSSA